jgi:hypothetical protein
LDDTMIRVMRLSAQGLYCSQIIMAMALETSGCSNPELVRSMAGLAFGCGTGQASCGVLTGAACVLALHAGRGVADEEESPAFMPMLEELNDWFAARAGGPNGAVTCEAIMGPGANHTPQQKCGALVGEAFVKLMEILTSNGFDPTDVGRPDGN